MDKLLSAKQHSIDALKIGKIDIRVNGKHITNYFIDFRVGYTDGRIELIEVKGFATPEWILKFRLTEALLEEIEPGAKLVLVK